MWRRCRATPAPTPEAPAWTLSDGTPGMENQVVGLAQRLGVPFVVKRVQGGGLWPWLPRPWPAELAPPWPPLLIATGRRTVVAALAIGRRSAGATFTVQIQSPGVDPARFGLVVAPRHDGLAGANVITTLGSLHGLTRTWLAAAATDIAPSLVALPRPRLAVLVGGRNRHARFGVAEAADLGRRVAHLARRAGGSLLITGSRRTSPEILARVLAEVGDVPHAAWDGRPPNPYVGWLAVAEAVVVTADSVNMTTEACATGRPVMVAPLPSRTAKLDRFHAAMRAAGHTRWLADDWPTWEAVPLDETGWVADEVRARLGWPG